MLSLQNLPIELVHFIAQDLDIHALATFAQTCSSFCLVAQSFLYRRISVSAWSRNLCVVPLLARRPDIARHVRSFYIAVDSSPTVFPAYYGLLAKAILNMSELTSLNLLVDSGVSWVLKEACTHTSYPFLTHFTCSFPFDENVIYFLGKTPSLLELEVDSIPSTFALNPLGASLPPTTIPRLEQFIGSPRTARALAPGRPIKSLHLNGSALTEEDIVLLARSTSPILVLGAVINSAPVPFLEHLYRYLPHLAYLRIMTTQTMHHPPAPEFYEQVANVLASFPELSAFELSGMHWGSQQKRGDGSKRVWQSSPLSTMTHLDDDILLENT
ncbi:hypothetical protein PISMIDRAFT_311236 [Pisolithus microcarpus 441]|uniref:F-box domain-containing protein n=1 Tax=Pisolithus microcarpus 441 TaxID=765257 RepID=A0A0D0AF95_9AGAM|nr:hypothetical protein BKA83DRAFT_311236 [Pisolithus microcarpus]KIK30798.1 hypothetical protein PISMIDRAFT_311236 [Pisolithus microcarpus 441]